MASADQSQPLDVGDSQTLHTIVEQPRIDSFVELTDDPNPIHRDAEAAGKTRFGEIIAPGMLGASLIPGALTRLTDETVVYLSQDLEFLAPLKPGDSVHVETDVVEQVGDDRYRVRTEVTRSLPAEVAIRGEATILID